jgi:4-diphosphocytidyl-2-C-methyl-D-erythritol kinase
MLTFPNAKINLGLNVVERRADGYHNIETFFYPIELCDALEIVPSRQNGEVTFYPSGIKIDGDAEKNLVVKAYHALKSHINLPSVEIYLHKRIPFGAGLGGGSSDAAFALKMLNDLCGSPLSLEELEKLASTLGADCSVFIRNKPVLATGIGNIFEPVNISLSGYRCVVLKPDISVPTPVAYRAITPRKPDVPLKSIIGLPPESWKDLLTNDFEKPIFALYPENGRLKEKLYEAGAIYAAISGSGSSVFGLFSDIPDGLEALFPDIFYWEGKLVQ